MPTGPSTGVFKIISMQRDYREVDPIAAALAGQQIKSLGLPARCHVRKNGRV